MNIGLGIGIPFNRSQIWLSLFDPSKLFTAGVNGAWYDPSDINLTWRRNLLTYTEQFDNAAWTNSGILGFGSGSVKNATTSPDGTVTADFVVPSQTSSVKYTDQAVNTISSLPYTWSAYIKAGGYSSAVVYFISASPPFEFCTATIDLVSGQISSAGGFNGATYISSRSDDAGNNWWRVFLTGSIGAKTNMVARVYVNSAAPFAGDGTSGIYIWGAQLEQGSTATAYQRITDGVQDYLQYQAQPVLYRDAAGTLPVTAVEQPVGLMLDKSKQLVLGSELVTNGDFSSGTGWSVGTNWTISGGFATHTSGADGYITQSLAGKVTAGKTYKITSVFTGTAPILAGGNLTASNVTLVSGDIYVIANGTSLAIYSNANCTIDNISVRELPGNHAFNSSGNSANFPVLSARYNLLTKTEDLTDATVWNYKINSTAVDYQTVNFSGIGRFGRATDLATGVQYTCSVEVKAGTKTGTVRLEDSNNSGSWPSVTLNNNWQRLIISYTPIAAPYISVVSTDGNSGTVLVRNWDMRVSNDALNQPSYQRVNTATDYDTVGFKPYLRFNGVSQWLQTNSIDFTYGDKMFVSAGVRKLSDGAVALLFETSTDSNGNNGSFYVAAPFNNGISNYAINSRGTIGVASAGSGFVAPITNVISGIGNISGDQAILRVNGTQAAISASDQGTGNYGNYPLFVGARAGTSLWFNGRLYGMVVAGKQASAAEIQDTEKYIAVKTGFGQPLISGIPSIEVIL